jgi:hypothetical protein
MAMIHISMVHAAVIHVSVVHYRDSRVQLIRYRELLYSVYSGQVSKGVVGCYNAGRLSKQAQTCAGSCGGP